MKKLYRLKNDTRWNYGIRIVPDFRTLHGKTLQIFCFKQNRIPEIGEAMQIHRGFWFDVSWVLRLERWWSWSLRTKTIDKYKKLTATTWGKR